MLAEFPKLKLVLKNHFCLFNESNWEYTAFSHFLFVSFTVHKEQWVRKNLQLISHIFVAGIAMSVPVSSLERFFQFPLSEIA